MNYRPKTSLVPAQCQRENKAIGSVGATNQVKRCRPDRTVELNHAGHLLSARTGQEAEDLAGGPLSIPTNGRRLVPTKGQGQSLQADGVGEENL